MISKDPYLGLSNSGPKTTFGQAQWWSLVKVMTDVENKGKLIKNWENNFFHIDSEYEAELFYVTFLFDNLSAGRQEW